MNKTVPIVKPVSHLNKGETAQYESAFSTRGDPLRVLQRKIDAVMRFVGCTEKEAEDIVLMRIDNVIQNGMPDIAELMQTKRES